MSDLNTEFTLTHAHHTAVVSPFGASLRRYAVKNDDGTEWNAVWGYHGGLGKRGGQGDVLIPFPGRIKGGVYSFGQQTHELLKNDKDGPNAIHGFVRTQLFHTQTVSSTHAVFTLELDAAQNPLAGYPFSLSIQITYSIGADGLTTRFQIANSGADPAPVGAGFHPYFCGDDGELADWHVMIPARNYIELENFVPTGRCLPVEKTDFDFRKPRLIGHSRYNDCVANLDRGADGWSEAWVQSKNSSRRVSIRMDQSFDYVVIYTGDQIPAPDQRRGFAIEPMSCAPDAFNRPEWGLCVLLPGENLTGTYIIRAE